MTLFKPQSINSIYRLIIASAIIFFLCLNILVLYAGYNQRLIIQTERNRYQSLKAILELTENTEDLTKMARLYTITGNKKYKEFFYNILAIRDGKAKRPEYYSPFYWNYILGGKTPHQLKGDGLTLDAKISKLDFTAYELELLKQAKERTAKLTAIEEQAFNLMEKDKPASAQIIKNGDYVRKAQFLLHSPQYLEMKAEILEPLEQFQATVDLRISSNFTAIQKRQQYILYTFQAIILTALILCIIAYRYTGQRLIKPIRKLHKQAERVSHGDYSSRNNIQSRNELEVLGQIFNKMCDYIEQDIQEREHLTDLLRNSEARFRNAIEYAPIGMAIKSLDGRITQANQALSDILGYQAHALKNLRNDDIIHRQDLNHANNMEKKLLHDESGTYQYECRLLHRDGHEVWALISESVLNNNQGKPMNLIMQIHDISQRKKNEIEMTHMHKQMSAALVILQERERENALLTKMNRMLLTCQNKDEAYKIISITTKDLFHNLSGAIGIYNETTNEIETIHQWGNHQLGKKIYSSKNCWALRNGNIYSVNDPEHAIICSHFIKTPPGGYLDLPLIVRGNLIGLLTLMCSKGETIDSSQEQLAITFSENIKLALANINLREALRHQALRDGLTGLFNRRYLDETLPRELEQMKRNNHKITVAMLDIDDFKYCNDEYGHEAGDDVLKAIGKQLQFGIRAGDIVCRLGGDEFLIILIDADSNEAIDRLHVILNKIKATKINYQGETLPDISLSAGIATAPDHGTTMDEVMGAADEALYEAKNSGKNQIVIYTPKARQK